MAKFEDRENRRKASIIGSMVDSSPAPAGGRRGRPAAEREIKKRVSLSVLPSLYEDIRKIAFVERRSISDLVEELLDQYRAQHKNELSEHERITRSPREN